MKRLNNSNVETKLVTFSVSRSEFVNKAGFINYCSQNQINGDWSQLWNVLDLLGTMNVFSPKV